MKVEPYLIFDGNCEKAFNFYKSVFESEFTTISRFKDMPEQEGMKVKQEEKEKILHVALPIGKETMLMGSDDLKLETKFGNNVSLSIQTESEEQTDKIFKILAQSGKTIMPLSKTFWNAYFGMCVDKFGVHWMVNYNYDQEAK